MLSRSNKKLMRNKKKATFYHFPLCFHTLLKNSIVTANARGAELLNVPVTRKIIIAFVYSFKTTASNNFAHKKGNTRTFCHLPP